MFEIILTLFAVMILALLVIYYPKQSRRNKNGVVNAEKAALNLLKIKHELGIKASFEAVLVNQSLVLDASARKVLVVNNKNFTSGSYPLDTIRSLKVVNSKTALLPGKTSPQTSLITKLISIEMFFENQEKPVIITVFDHSVHAQSQLVALEKHAWYLHEQITKAKIHELLSA